MQRLTDIPVDIDPQELRKRLRLGSPEEVEALIDTARPLIKASAVFEACYIEARPDDGVQLEGVPLRSRLVKRNFEKAERVFPYVVTIGPELEEAIVSCGDLVRQYYLDVFGNLAVTAAREYLEGHIQRRFGLGKLSRMSPGSLKEWPIEEQRKLFSILGNVEGSIGVRLTGSCLMIPRKSVSGIFFPTEIPFLSCQLCPRENCPGRHASYDEDLAAEYQMDK
jgi:hypothetical protein